MYRYLLGGLLLMLTACSGSSSEKDANTPDGAPEQDTLQSTAAVDTLIDLPDNQLPEHSTYFIVVADTGLNYYSLRDRMVELNRNSGLPIDTLERSYLSSKNKIALPENHEDDTYAGEYVPRRFPSENLSVEYLNTYRPVSDTSTMALVAGIYENVAQADSLCRLLRKNEKKAFRFKAQVYTGCMH